MRPRTVNIMALAVFVSTLTIVPCPASPPVARPAKSATAAPEDAMRRYLESWLRGDSRAMWEHLSKSTKKALPLAEFQKNVASSDKDMLKLTRILSVRMLREKKTPTVAYVQYQVEARITAREADKLRKAGHPDAKPGLWVFHPTTRKMVLENGNWLIDHTL